MTSYCFRTLIFLLPAFAAAQWVDQVLVEPAMNVSWNTNSRWSLNTTIAQRTLTYDSIDALHVQIAQFAQYEIGFYSQLGAGVMYREVSEQGAPEELRTTQQFVHTKTYNALQIAHRLRWDQRWRDDLLTHRWRYRISGSIPLDGAVTDASEYYLTAGVETLFIAEMNKRPAYDQRITAGIGKKLGSSYKLQFTTQYRWEDFTAVNERLLFLNLSLYYSL
ncbi:DUF2490 domain-containing protein [Nonlabens marinus]|uniref:DUF2490 domain-containing protein n=1 Tax=Nonlabens marinus S1-08 TaxID=1454201 RepID=W8VPF9_9FLAO|nr:DUF2490 domain-containing protein [Nonlabens marinus]BAO55029.1 hypothetical protein NMS_1020 [Nonlabens marinus S1-08]